MMTDEENAEFTLMMTADGNGRFAVPLDCAFNEHGQAAFDRGAGVLFNLIDVCPVLINQQPVTCRIFKLTDAGLKRLAALAAMTERQMQ